jgi:transcriptional regulator with XRE-family HTH domain
MKRTKLIQARKRVRLTQEVIAERMNVSVAQISRWENGHDGIPSQRLTSLCQAYGAPIGELLDENSDFLVPGPTLFIRGAVQAGHFAEPWEVHDDEWERYIGRADIVAPLRRRFGLRVMGESMNEIYPPGTILDCVQRDPFEDIPNGKRVIVQRRLHGNGIETTVKEYLRDADGIEWLVPRSRNPAFQAPFRCDQSGDNIEAIEVIAIVVASIQPE